MTSNTHTSAGVGAHTSQGVGFKRLAHRLRCALTLILVLEQVLLEATDKCRKLEYKVQTRNLF